MKRMRPPSGMKACRIGFAILAVAGFAAGQAAKRCDLWANATPSPDTNAVCLDLKIDSALGGPVFHTAGNATRIARDSLKFCKNAFEASSSGNADIVFIMDNTGGMEWGNPFYCTFPGDPTAARASVIQRGMEYESGLVTVGTAGFISFSGPDTIGIECARLQPLLDVSPSNSAAAANLKTLESKVIVDDSLNPNVVSCARGNVSDIGSSWLPSFDIARSWLADSNLAKTQNHAIVMISDGATNDFPQVLAETSELPPVYAIFLGDSLDNQGLPNQASENLRKLTQVTHGQFYSINPTDTVSMRLAMKTVIFTVVTKAIPPESLRIRNTVSGQSSRAVSMITSADGNVNTVLDSVLALDSGANHFDVRITLNNGDTASYPFHVQADGPDAAQSAANLACYDPASLSLIDGNGQEAISYATGPTSYTFRLARSPSDLSSVTIRAASSDTSQPAGWGDFETVSLPLDSSSGAIAVNESPVPYPFNGNSQNPVRGDGVLEADPGGRLLLTWVHPRDPRDNASSALRAVAESMTLQRLADVFQGTTLAGSIANPVVFRAGTSSSNTCFYNCGDEAEAATLLNPPRAPSFAFHSGTPFRFSLYLYDQTGRFVNKAVDSVDASAWQALPRDGTGMVPVILSLVPRSQNGRQIGAGVYILRIAITTAASGSIAAATHKFTEEFGYVAP